MNYTNATCFCMLCSNIYLFIRIYSNKHKIKEDLYKLYNGYKFYGTISKYYT
jgi:hypothetical protein